MKFKDLTEAQIEYAKSVYQNKELSWDDRMNLLVKFFVNQKEQQENGVL
jgi:hypothetical protein